MRKESNSGSEKLTRVVSVRITTNEYQKVKRKVFESNTNISDSLRERLDIERW